MSAMAGCDCGGGRRLDGPPLILARRVAMLVRPAYPGALRALAVLVQRRRRELRFEERPLRAP